MPHNLDKLDEILKMELGGETYYAVKEAEALLGVNLDDLDYIEIVITESGEKKKTRFAKKQDFDRFKDERDLSGFNKLLRRAADFNPNTDKKK